MQEKTQNQFINEVFKTKADSADTRLRVLYLYRILQKYSDENHPLTTKQIIQFMEKEHRIHMHRTSVSEYISLITAEGEHRYMPLDNCDEKIMKVAGGVA